MLGGGVVAVQLARASPGERRAACYAADSGLKESGGACALCAAARVPDWVHVFAGYFPRRQRVAVIRLFFLQIPSDSEPFGSLSGRLTWHTESAPLRLRGYDGGASGRNGTPYYV